MSFPGGIKIVYKSEIELKCRKCFRKITINELVVRAGKRLRGYVCSGCEKIDVDKSYNSKDKINYFILTDDWFYNANGNAVELMEEIARACEYSELKRTRSFANMVGYHLKNYSDLLSARFFCLLAEVEDQFPEVKSEIQMVFDEQF